MFDVVHNILWEVPTGWKKISCCRRVIKVIFALGFCLFSLSGLAQKTDTIILSDGSKIVGEIKSMQYSILQFKTDGMKTVNIKWYTVRHIIAPNKRFSIEINRGIGYAQSIYGSIDSTANPGYIRITTEDEVGVYHISEISSILQIKQRIWGRFSGNIGLGLSYTKQTDLWELTYSAGVTYTAPKFTSVFNSSSIRTFQDSISTRKEDFTINSFFLLRDKYYAVNYLGFNSNSQLGIESRLFIGGGGAFNTVSTEHIKMFTSIGVVTNSERSTESSETTSNWEGTVQMDFRTFKYASPEFHSTILVRYFPSLTIAGRHRIETEVELNWEVINDVYLSLSGYFNFDSKPQEGATSTSDYGFSTQISYKFGL